MLEIILAIITGVLTIVSTVAGAIAVRKSKCTSGCCEFEVQTKPEEEEE